EVIGVITEKLLHREVGHTGLTELDVVQTMLERKTRMAELSDAFISLPGGMGTMDELFEMVTWGLLGLHGQKPKPNGIFNVAGYYNHLVSFIIEEMVGKKFLNAEHASNLVVGDDFPTLLADMEAIDLISKIESWDPK
ncbi:MAG: TIGR00730 family Rossman fold protein, partial [Verrucomicrobiales bacterium]|nr:TIGR00730 family Rossman fold protein [Verrucomicrobiales bacterium]